MQQLSERSQLMIVLLVLTAVFASAAGWYIPHARHRKWYSDIECLIKEFASRRPPEVSPKQWAQCLTHTWNLHTNYGHISYWKTGPCNRFRTELKTRLKGKVGLQTIDWFWDAYVTEVPRAKSYLRYRPTLPHWLQEAESMDYRLEEWPADGVQSDCARVLNES